MKKNFLLSGWLLLATVLMLGVSSCSDDNDPSSGSSGDNTEQLLIGKWRPVKVLGEDVDKCLTPNMKDDILEFKADKTVTYNENGTYYCVYGLCNEEEHTEGTWSLRNAPVGGTGWIVNLPQQVYYFVQDFFIMEITSTKLILNNGFEYEFERIN